MGKYNPKSFDIFYIAIYNGEKMSVVISTGSNAKKTFSILEEVFLLSKLINKTKEFLSIQDQIENLKSRHLIFNDEEKAKRYLLTQNYYNIINGYGNYFPKNGEHYINGTTFDEILYLYIYEREIKHALFTAILSAETHLKSIFAHRYAEMYQHTKYPYLDIKCYSPEKTLGIIKTIAKLSQTITQYKSRKGTSIAHYIEKYNEVPIWVLANYLEFGVIRAMLSNSTTSLQNIVAKDCLTFIYEFIQPPVKFEPEVMISFIENINDVRNVCAHNNRLLDFQCRRDCKHWAPLHNEFNISAQMPRNTVYTTMLSLRCFVTKVEYATVHNKFLKETKKLKNRLNSVDIDTILSKLGFPNSWHIDTKKRDSTKNIANLS